MNEAQLLVGWVKAKDILCVPQKWYGYKVSTKNLLLRHSLNRKCVWQTPALKDKSECSPLTVSREASQGTKSHGQHRNASIDALTSLCGLAIFNLQKSLMGCAGAFYFTFLFSRMVDGRRVVPAMRAVDGDGKLSAVIADKDETFKSFFLVPLIFRRTIFLTGKYTVGAWPTWGLSPWHGK